MIPFINAFRDCFGVELICTMLDHHRQSVFMTARGYRAAKRRMPSQRSLLNCELIPIMIDINRQNYGVHWVRKMWPDTKRAGMTLGRDQIASLMRAAGIRGVVRGRKPVTTRPVQAPDMRLDLVQRNLRAPGPNQLSVAGITYVRTTFGFVCTAFVIDIYSKKIVGWAATPPERRSAPL